MEEQLKYTITDSEIKAIITLIAMRFLVASLSDDVKEVAPEKLHQEVLTLLKKKELKAE